MLSQFFIGRKEQIHDEKGGCERHEVIVEARVDQVEHFVYDVVDAIDTLSVLNLQVDVLGSLVSLNLEQYVLWLELILRDFSLGV